MCRLAHNYLTLLSNTYLRDHLTVENNSTTQKLSVVDLKSSSWYSAVVGIAVESDVHSEIANISSSMYDNISRSK